MNLNELKNIYFSAEHDLDKELFMPIARSSNSIRCMSGYFSSSVLSELAQSLIYFMNANVNEEIQFIVSPNFSEQDLAAIKKAIDIDANFIPILFPDFELTEDSFKYKTVEALSYLIATKKLTLKIAIQNQGLFHTKCWLFETSLGTIAIHGSVNATQSGISRNFEQIAVNKSWENTSSENVVDKIKSTFQTIWDGHYKGLETISLNKSTIDFLLTVYEQLDNTDDINSLLMNQLVGIVESENLSSYSQQKLIIPHWLNYTSGNFAHQGKAIDSWLANDGRGILSIATGGGKTLTSLVAASIVANQEKSLLIIIAVPTVALLDQWSDDVRKFCVDPVNSQSLPSNQLGQQVNTCVRRLRLGNAKCEVLIATHDGLKSNRFIGLLEKAEKSTALMLIGDEVHNLGSIGFQNAAPDIFKYRLGLSATFIRQFDEIGTQFLLDYFGPVVYEFGLKDAIGVCLVPFDYHVHSVTLDENEENEWAELTYEIRRLSYAFELPDGTNEKERWKLLCLKRRRIVESAGGKIAALAAALPQNKDAVKRTLIFCTDKYPEQINAVNALLINRHISFHQITAEETANKKQLKNIIKEFDSDELQVLTSKRVLDEGFNIPQTETAFLLASNTVRRQWVQRLGRVLRQSSKTNKVKAVIHDFVVIPAHHNDVIDSDLKSLIIGELSRVQFFDSLSQNGLEKGGTADIVEQLLELME
ncbi:MAG: DEAD/DEAH box helicase family protein [Methylobacter sp.]|nr:DEAD/DEAH box helicase family protein [Methylobacter sp.]